jgi:predicted enzyme related to lactoylglutathione lyase
MSPSRWMSAAFAGAALIATSAGAAMAQGSCVGRPGQNTPACDTTHLAAPFAATGWKTAALDHFTMHAVDYKKEAAYYMALMNWKLRSDDGKQAVLDIGDVGTVVIVGGYTPPPPPPPRVLSAADSAALAARVGGGGGGGRGGGARQPITAAWDSFAWEISPWNAKTVEAELRKRGLNPVADNSGPKGCESFHVTDPNGFDLQISNGCYSKDRKASAKAITWSQPAPFESTNWNTVWLDHISFQVSDYKAAVEFYKALIGWIPTGDEGSQNETMMCDVCGNSLIRGGNSLSPTFDKNAPKRAVINHISFGINPFDPTGTKAELDKRGLTGRPDTGGSLKIDDPAAKYKSYHTTSPAGWDLQISNATKGTRAVR